MIVKTNLKKLLVPGEKQVISIGHYMTIFIMTLLITTVLIMTILMALNMGKIGMSSYQMSSSILEYSYNHGEQSLPLKYLLAIKVNPSKLILAYPKMVCSSNGH